MRILIMGGTLFLGRHIVEAALRNKHEITLFNRGLRNPGLFSEVERLTGDRDSNLSSLKGRYFDVVIDPSAYRPGQVESLLDALGALPRHYTLVSTVSVYASFPPGSRYDEQAAVLTGDEGYGALKARTEEALQRRLPSQTTIVRPGLIVGPHDPTGRFTYWMRRIDRGGDVLVPGRPDRPLQFIDARDLAEWIVLLTERSTSGVFNATGATVQTTMAQLLDCCVAEVGREACLHWLDDDTVTATDVEAWTELPLWIPENHPEFGGFMRANNDRAIAAGLTFRSMRQTVADTLAWSREVPDEPPSPVKVVPLSPERELAILEQNNGRLPSGADA
ncbi:NAD-dependent epimerase/dehydratase family protein [Paraburkholderia tropica]|uniref:2'-hydroxyisoflavone reductase n=1 Tax=Paraburkholderia tropica TaxID=92647 RepID=A0AAQ1JYN5_9BURK|nr:NAD-dependent epimerase/dehydratase family protein [Paraburkholderia tropica]RQN33887.1 NAD-dependent epimerase/dehydratase family protein [Paraburkholderia tropica]SEK15500.1 2'-hydroxyisoflavone reductase [Paraburkholderia tropica]